MNPQEYLAYHRESVAAGDIDPSHDLMRYVCDRFELNMEQRYWLAWLYAMTYCGASVYYVYNEFPDYENVDVGRLQRWWGERGRQGIICQTDRRWVRSNSLFVPAYESYTTWLDGSSQQSKFASIVHGLSTPEARYDAVYKAAKSLYTFGQFTMFLYLEALHTITDLDLEPTDLDLDKADSCRNGLYLAYGMDDLVRVNPCPIPEGARERTMEAWRDVRQALQPGSTVWEIETTLCAYKKFRWGKRYIGYYIDRQGAEIAKLSANVSDGVCWDVLWQFRKETYPQDYLVETFSPVETLAKRGVPGRWRDYLMAKTTHHVKVLDLDRVLRV